MITSVGEHKVTVEVELKDGTVVRRVVKFSGGNPLFHAEEARQAIGVASEWISGGLVGMYGDIRDSDHAGLNSVESVRAGRR